MACQVLHILPTARSEGCGLARMTAALARGLDPQRYAVHAWFMAGDGPMRSELSAAGAQVRVFNWARGARDLAGAWQFWTNLQEEKFSIIHMHFGGRSVRWLIRWATRAKVVVHLHGRILEARGFAPRRQNLAWADAAIATSRAVAEWTDGLLPRVVYPGVSLHRRELTAADPSEKAPGCVVGTAGRLIELKGIEYLIRAMALLRAERPEVQLQVAGDGPERSALEEEVRSLHLQGCVKFLGWQSDLVQSFERWDVYAQPSLEEGFGMAALEAMAAGLAVVATGVGGLPELVENGRTGWLVRPGDPAALAAKLGELLNSPRQRRVMGDVGRDRAVRCFSVERMVQQVQEIYDGIMA